MDISIIIHDLDELFSFLSQLVCNCNQDIVPLFFEYIPLQYFIDYLLIPQPLFDLKLFRKFKCIIYSVCQILGRGAEVVEGLSDAICLSSPSENILKNDQIQNESSLTTPQIIMNILEDIHWPVSSFYEILLAKLILHSNVINIQDLICEFLITRFDDLIEAQIQDKVILSIIQALEKSKIIAEQIGLDCYELLDQIIQKVSTQVYAEKLSSLL